MALTGEVFIGQSRERGAETFQAVNPATGQKLEPAFTSATAEHAARAAELAWAAFDTYRDTSPEQRAAFLESIAEEILAIGDELIERAMSETGLPRPRLEGERGRTVGQLRLFAQVVRQGDWLDARIDPAMPERTPLPRSDLRLRQIAVGPVAVFGASNFPLAFSVAGGDTASALAAGCPVVVKGHPAHPGTSEMVGRAIQAAVAKAGLPEGVFSLVTGHSHELGGALVTHPHIKSVGFTGSRGGGLALVKLAAARPEPIPVFAEMSSINPVYLMRGALAEKAEDLGRAFVGSLTMGAGQFCTNPGLVVALESPDLDRFVQAAGEAVGQASPAVMLTPGIHQAYVKGLERLAAVPGIQEVGRGLEPNGPHLGQAAVFSVSAEVFLADKTLSEENFGASSVIIRCRDVEELMKVTEELEGQLTATLHMSDADHEDARKLVRVLERKAGRILVNGWPTGVEVSHAMVHGGPYPATSDSRFTSVGTLAIRRFLRPVSYQDLPAALLPEALKPENPLGLRRLVNGAWEG
ncbi:aldehyde dehydrogenase (NADP(+)) [Phenylobacterium deserti]|uniref:2,5-dioxovalerate dehydrogenase n=1 Tax=Phenylobacterium deserti TaxID=1914756 RepID=A0A328AZ76_9CAUL|nr:aldehyde dehydrogenase (NADP(+)) [Phenylobacterium deserti]RAK58128.1 aldehyde dehydrogenase (NADP(+)) [Phenylobacterium deserti]